jgi:hypothetical protein
MRIFRKKVTQELESNSLGFADVDVDQAIKTRLEHTSELISEQLDELEFEEVNNLVKVLGIIPLTYPLLASVCSALAVLVATEAYKIIFGEEE